MKRAALIFSMIFLAGIVHGQDYWTLDDCIEYAVMNNLSLQREEVALKQTEVDLSEQRAKRFPSLSVSSDAYINYGRSISPEDNIITFDPNFYNTYGIYSSLNVFNGFMQSNNITAKKYSVMMQVSGLNQAKNDLALEITDLYYRYLIARGISVSAEANTLLAEKQYKKAEAFAAAGRSSKSDLLEVKSQLSASRLLLVRARNDELLALENLKLALRINAMEDFRIAPVNDTLPVLLNDTNVDPEELYASALEKIPSMSVLKYKNAAMEKEYAAAKGLMSPGIIFFAGWQTTYFNSLNSSSETLSFTEQFSNNNNPYFGISLSIPVFNKWNYLSDLRRAKLNLRDSELELEQGKDDLKREITIALLELKAVEQEYISAKDNLESSLMTFNTVEEKFFLGLANATELSEARTNLFAANVDLLRIILEHRLKTITIRFFQTGIISDNI